MGRVRMRRGIAKSPQAEGKEEKAQSAPEVEGGAGKPDRSANVGERSRSWMNVVSGSAQLTLDLVRVVREVRSLYREFSPKD